METAVALPLLLLILFGIIEAGWAFNQQVEVRHGTREAARLVAVDYGTDAEVTAEVCERMHFSGQEAGTGITVSTPSGTSVGDPAAVVIAAPYKSLTGFFNGMFDGSTISSTVEIRLEQVPNSGLGTGTTNYCT